MKFMKNKKSINVILSIFVILILSLFYVTSFSPLVGAADPIPTQTALPADDINIPKVTADEILQNGLNIAYFLTGLAAVVIIISAGFRYTTSGGDAEAIKKAKNTILYAVVGLLVVAMAFVITQFVLGSF